MIEWKRMPKGSLRYETPEFSLDVWPYMTTKKIYRWTVLNNTTGHYEDEGLSLTEDLACEAALKAAKI